MTRDDGEILSRYENMPTDDLIRRGVDCTATDSSARQRRQIIVAMAIRLAAYEPIVTGLRGWPSPDAMGDGRPEDVKECLLCGSESHKEPVDHYPSCPWLLAQETR